MLEPKLSQGKGNEDTFKFLEFLITRLNHIISWTQNATKLIYAVNGAILASVYFGFGKIPSTYYIFLGGGVLALHLAAINYLHANFLKIHYTWYKATELEIRNLFSTMDLPTEVQSFDVGKVQGDLFASDKAAKRIFLFRRTHATYMWLHAFVAGFLMLCSVLFFVLAALNK